MEWSNLASLITEQPDIMCFLKEYVILSITIEIFLQNTIFNLNRIKFLVLASRLEETQVIEEAVKWHHKETMRQIQNVDILMTTDMVSPKRMSWYKVCLGTFVE